jgi:hypothetical protein
MIAVHTQGLAGASEAQQMDQKGLEDIEHALSRRQIAGLDTPAVRPAIDVQIILLERRRRWDNRV